MGNNKYKKLSLSDMISSASWLYNKLGLALGHYHPKHKDRNSPSPRVAAKPGSVTNLNPRKSYHFGRALNPQLANSPLKTVRSTNAKSRGRVTSGSLSSSASSTSNTTTCSTPPHHRSRRPSPELRFDRILTPDIVDKTNSSSSSSSSSASHSLSEPDLVAGDIPISVVNLTPIMTKKKKMLGDASAERKHGTSKRFSSSLSTATNSPGVRLRTQSPRLLAAARRIQARKVAAAQPNRCDLETNGKCGGIAVVKSSFDPWKDFKESMVEMIVENGIKESEDLEELLACYLSLNTEEYHEVIVAVFKQIWCVLTDITFA